MFAGSIMNYVLGTGIGEVNKQSITDVVETVITVQLATMVILIIILAYIIITPIVMQSIYLRSAIGTVTLFCIAIVGLKVMQVLKKLKEKQ